MSRRTKRRKRERVAQQEQRTIWLGWLQVQWDALKAVVISLDESEDKQRLLGSLGSRPEGTEHE